QATEEITDDFLPAIFLAQQLLAFPCLRIGADARASISPFAAQLAAHRTRGDSDFGIVADAFHLAGIGFRVDVEHRLAGLLREPYRGLHSDAALAEGFETEILGRLELCDIRH